ncbi:hypothetical protein BGZ67_007396 [Mortierella alpina]|nr:hypothetical protein BGZ67_007396 [Mortierella alpina]
MLPSAASLSLLRIFHSGPEASTLLKIAVGTNLTAYFDNGVDSAGSAAALLAATFPQIVDVIKTVQTSLGSTLGIADPAFQIVYDFADQLTKASSDLAACTGAKVDCTGLVILSGYSIKIAMPIIRAYLTFNFPHKGSKHFHSISNSPSRSSAAIALLVLQPTIDKIADGLIAGDDKGISDLLKFLVDSTTGAAGSLLPAPLKAILVKNQASPTATIGPVTSGGPKPTEEPRTTEAPRTTQNPKTTAEPKTSDAPKTTVEPKNGRESKDLKRTPNPTDVVTNLATTTTSAVATATPTPDCIALIGPIKDVIRNLLVTIEGLPLGPEASQLLKIAVGTNLTAYFDNGIDTAGSTAAMLAATHPQIVDAIKGLQTSLGPALDIAGPVFQTLYDIVGQLTKASQDLVACTGAKVDCTGLVVLSGYAIRIAMPIIRAYLTYKFPPTAVALALLQPTIDSIADGLIAGNDMGSY